MALRPPSIFSMQLVAYLFLARKTAASATSFGEPNLPRGILNVSPVTSAKGLNIVTLATLSLAHI